MCDIARYGDFPKNSAATWNRNNLIRLGHLQVDLTAASVRSYVAVAHFTVSHAFEQCVQGKCTFFRFGGITEGTVIFCNISAAVH